MMRKRINKKGFTLVELLITITVLGIIMAIAIPLLTKLTSNSKETQSEVFKDSLLVAGRLYNDSYEDDTFGPKQYGCAKVPYSKLLKKGLVKPLESNNFECGYTVVKEDGSEEDSSGIIIRKVKDKYYYETIMFCKDKNKSANEVDDYVSGTEKFYYYKIDSNYCDESANDDTTPPTVYYTNTNYRYFYNKNNLPNPRIKVMDSGTGLINKIGVNADWSNGATKHEELLFSLKYGSGSTNWKQIQLPSELTSATANGTFNLKITEKNVSDMANNRINSSNRTRYIVSYGSGAISAFHPQKITSGQSNIITTPDTFRVENKVPEISVTLKTGSTVINNAGQWVNSNVTPTISMNDGTTGVISGLYKLEKKVGNGSWSAIWTNTTFNNTDAKNKTLNDTTQSSEQNQTYYYRVTDWAGNSKEVNVKIQIDKTPPTCAWTGESTSWTNANRTITVTGSDSFSGINNSYKTKSWPYSTTTKTAALSYTIRDNAGNTTNCSKTANVYVDKTAPTCNWTGESTSWTNANRTITVTGSDSFSGINNSYKTKSWPYSTTTKTAALSYTIRDNAGNTTNCSKTANVYVDKTAPTCNWTGESTSWTNNNRTVTVTGTDSHSGINNSYKTKSWTYSSNTKNPTVSYTIRDNVGNTKECKKAINVYVDKCTSYNTNCGNYGSCNCSTNKKTRSCTRKSNFGSNFTCSTYNDSASCSCCTTPTVSHWTNTGGGFSCQRGGETVWLDGASHFNVTGCGSGLYGYMCYHNPYGASCAYRLSYNGSSYHQNNGGGHMAFAGNHWVYYRSSEYARGHLCNSSGQCTTIDEALPY